MDDWFTELAYNTHLTSDAASELDERGFVVFPGAVPPQRIESLAVAYDAAIATAAAEDIAVGRTNTRVSDFVNRGPEFDSLYLFGPLLAACIHVIGRPFKLSSLHARTLHAYTAAQGLHVDVPWQSSDWPLVGFIYMVDAFRPENGATRFVPGSHRRSATPEAILRDPEARHDKQVLACGSAGSLVVFNGSTWHGHSANASAQPRRSLQGAFIPREGNAATDFGARMHPETRARLTPLAGRVLAL